MVASDGQRKFSLRGLNIILPLTMLSWVSESFLKWICVYVIWECSGETFSTKRMQTYFFCVHKNLEEKWQEVGLEREGGWSMRLAVIFKLHISIMAIQHIYLHLHAIFKIQFHLLFIFPRALQIWSLFKLKCDSLAWIQHQCALLHLPVNTGSELNTADVKTLNKLPVM